MSPSAKPQPLVSVVIPTYNRAHCLDRTIRSVQNQTFTNWELIIVDNHSTDDTDALVASLNDPRIRLLKIHNEGVIAASRNKGFRAGTGKYVAFLDSDDWWLPEKLQASVEQLNAGADIVYHDLYIISSYPAKPWGWNRVETRQVNSPVFLDLLSNGSAIANSSVVVNRALLDQVGGFSEDPTLIAAEDYEAWLRLAMRSEAFVKVNKTLGYYWAGGGNISTPKRTLCYLMRLRELYANDLKEEEGCPVSAWLMYNLARTNWIIGNHQEGVYFAKKLIKKFPLNLFSLKLYVLWFLEIFRRRSSQGDSGS